MQKPLSRLLRSLLIYFVGISIYYLIADFHDSGFKDLQFLRALSKYDIVTAVVVPVILVFINLIRKEKSNDNKAAERNAE